MFLRIVNLFEIGIIVISLFSLLIDNFNNPKVKIIFTISPPYE